MKNTSNITKGIKMLTIAILLSLSTVVSASNSKSNDQTTLSYSINYSGKEKGMVVVKKKGCKDWSYILQDSTGAIISSRNCVTESDTLFGLTEGFYTISEVNPYGIGSSQSFKLSNRFRTKFFTIPTEERSMVQLIEESQEATEFEQDLEVKFTILKMKIRMNESAQKNNLL